MQRAYENTEKKCKDAYVIALLAERDAVEKLTAFAASHQEPREMPRYIVRTANSVTLDAVFEVMKTVEQDVFEVPFGMIALMDLNDSDDRLTELCNQIHEGAVCTLFMLVVNGKPTE